MPKYFFQYFLVFLLSLTLTYTLHFVGALEKLEQISYDWRVQTLASTKVVSDDIALIMIDQSSLEWMQNEQGLGWPWPRELYGAFTAFAQESGAKAVIFDIIFSEDSVYNKTDDLAFSEALKIIPTIGAIQLSDTKSSVSKWPSILPKPLIKECQASSGYKGIVFPIDEIAKAYSAMGAANATSDNDGVIRRVNLCHTFDNITIPSLAYSVYNYLYPQNNRSYSTSVIINYHNAPFSYKAYSAASIFQSWTAMQEGLEPSVQKESFKNKVIFVGMNASALFDQKASPLSSNHAGVDIQATILDNLISDSFIEPLSNLYTFLYLLIVGLFVTVLMMRAKKWYHFLVPVILIPTLIIISGYIFYYYDYWLEVSLVLSNVLLIILLSAIVGYILEGSQKRYLKNAFSHYVSPTIVDKLVENPENLKLGGESRELSIFFSDIQGFTSVSEKLDPEVLIEMLHQYLDALSTIIMEHEGTIDKYEGDAIIAFWNAPIDTKNHETLAVQASLACKEKLKELNPLFSQKYGVELKTRMGIHTGKVTVGNLGSAKHFDYSFIGDAGNLAARLEGVNKVFSTDILVSHVTHSRAKDLIFRKIATIKVVGRDENVEVYQPLDQIDESRFDEALMLFENNELHDAKKLFAELAEFDVVAKKYLEIIEQIEEKKLLWDGAIILTSK